MNLTLSECFESVDYLVDFSRSQITQLKADIDAHLKSSYGFVTEVHPKTLLRELKIKRLKPFPVHFRGRASSIVTDLRNTLDQATFAATLFLTGRESGYAHFPFGDTPDDLENSLSRRKAGRCKQIPPELYDVLRRIEPYPTGDDHLGGNDLLKFLSKISGPNKHRITLTVSAKISDGILRPPPGQGSYLYIPPGGPTDPPACIFPQNHWDDKAGELVLLALPLGSQTNLQADVTLGVAFGNSPLKNVNATGFLSAAHEAVSNAVNQIRAEAGKIKAARG
jgi:hypothetical protein